MISYILTNYFLPNLSLYLFAKGYTRGNLLGDSDGGGGAAAATARVGESLTFILILAMGAATFILILAEGTTTFMLTLCVCWRW